MVRALALGSFIPLNLENALRKTLPFWGSHLAQASLESCACLHDSVGFSNRMSDVTERMVRTSMEACATCDTMLLPDKALTLRVRCRDQR